jgi:hypothetical protein
MIRAGWCRRETRGVALAVGLTGLALSGCHARSSDAPRVSDLSHQAPTPRPAAAVPAQPLDPTEGGAHPYGVAMTSRQGVGPATVPVSWGHGRNGRITVRISCVGAGPARITDAGGGLVLGLAGCSQYAIYTAGPIPLKAADRSITLAVGNATRWRLAIYVS